MTSSTNLPNTLHSTNTPALPVPENKSPKKEISSMVEKALRSCLKLSLEQVTFTSAIRESNKIKYQLEISPSTLLILCVAVELEPWLLGLKNVNNDVQCFSCINTLSTFYRYLKKNTVSLSSVMGRSVYFDIQSRTSPLLPSSAMCMFTMIVTSTLSISLLRQGSCFPSVCVK